MAETAGSATTSLVPREVALHNAVEVAGPETSRGDLLEFLTSFYADTPDDDLLARQPADLLGAALSQRALAGQRSMGESKVRVYTATVDSHGWDTGHSIVQVVTDDMPFLVDSVTMALQSRDIGLHLLVHPIIPVRRDEAGNLLEVLPQEQRRAVAQDADDLTLRESWMLFEIDRHVRQGLLDEIAHVVQDVLVDVRRAVEDWEPMTDRALDLARGIGAEVPEQLRAEAVEARRFLAWLCDNHFTFLGYREYDVVGEGRDQLQAVPDSGLGILRDHPDRPYRLTGEAAARALEPQVLILTKANSRSTVHRPVYLDYVGVKRFDDQGLVVGERRFLGLYTSNTYTDSVLAIPVVDTKVRQIAAASGYDPGSHSGREQFTVLEGFPRDELFQASAQALQPTIAAVMQLTERRQTRLFLRPDTYGRFVTALVYLPRDRFNTSIRLRIEAILTQALDAESCDFSTQVSESALARLYFVMRPGKGRNLRQVNPAEVEAGVIQATRSWQEDLLEALVKEHGDRTATRIMRDWDGGFSEAYRADVSARAAVGDLVRLEAAVEDADQDRADTVLRSSFYEPLGAPKDLRRFKIYRTRPLSLTTILPYFQNLGLEVVDEHPYTFTRADGRTAHIYDFGLRSAALADLRQARDLVTDAFTAAWSGRSESDRFDRLVVAAGLGWRQVVMLRACAKYLRQAASPFSQEYIEDTLLAHVDTTRLLVEFFEARFDPDLDAQHRQQRTEAIGARVLADLDQVASLDEDRILRSYLALLKATVRTTFYQVDDQGEPKPYVGMKIRPQDMPDLPQPRPAHEIWVYSPRVEGVHLRFGAVARGGLRWSDRREDFRTEVLGLVKAQMVKNAVIVPTGAKGGFFAKHLPDPAVDRNAWLAEGISCYRTFISAMLDLTDDLVADPQEPDGRRLEPPPRLVRHDGDDHYLVVAADKGTASFSDIANEVSAEYGFWLGDAFASGGSAGYDHKEMGITARGAWESVKRHFRELGHDTQSQPFTVVGIGDMSGDVFGNGMLLSDQIRLVAAFDHRHIFLDPDPDPATSHAERRRLYELPRSSWADYDEGLISAGGGVHPRTAKSIEITDQVARLLDLEAGAKVTPAELMNAVLKARVDLLWNGGIGTYIKASTQTNAEVGDKANDSIRIDGRQVRARVIGEGGNLGLTQRGRIEAALAGRRVNTDAIDNSAGVDTSDHEVNIKILLGQVMADGDLTLKQRNQLLAEMTGTVAEHVLRHNYEQNVLLGNARYQADIMLPVHLRLLQDMERKGQIDRALEDLPSDAEIEERIAAGGGLTSPEFAVLVAYSKIVLKGQLLESVVPDEEYFERLLTDYFPYQVSDRYADRLPRHRLRRELIATRVAGDLVNRGGISFVFRAVEETGAPIEQIVRAYAVARHVFDQEGYVQAVQASDLAVSTDCQASLYLALRRLIDRAVRWLLQNHSGRIDVAAEVERFSRTVSPWLGRMRELVDGNGTGRMDREVAGYVEQGVAPELAERAAGLLDEFTLLDIAELAEGRDTDLEPAARVYFAISDRYGLERLLVRVSGLPREDRWQALARGALRDDLYGAWMGLTAAVLASTPDDAEPRQRIDAWEQRNAEQLTRVRHTLSEIDELPTPDLASMSVALRQLRSLIRSASSAPVS